MFQKVYLGGADIFYATFEMSSFSTKKKTLRTDNITLMLFWHPLFSTYTKLCILLCVGIKRTLDKFSRDCGLQT